MYDFRVQDETPPVTVKEAQPVTYVELWKIAVEFEGRKDCVGKLLQRLPVALAAQEMSIVVLSGAMT